MISWSYCLLVYGGCVWGNLKKRKETQLCRELLSRELLSIF